MAAFANSVVEVKNHDFSIEQVANSGQCFRISKIDEKNVWKVVAFGRALKIQQMDEITHIFHCSLEEYEAIWADYFDFRRDYGEIKNSIRGANDPYLSAAIECGFGLRILRQDVWEVMVSFIISQRNSIPRIKNTIEKLCVPYGDTFPSPQILAKCGEKFFRGMGLGYRAKYLVEVARDVDSGTCDVEFLKTLSCKEAVKYLKHLDGVGEKVANCIALYGLHKLEAFPVDTWIRRIVEKQYGGASTQRHFHPMLELPSNTCFSTKGRWRSEILSETFRVIQDLTCLECREFSKFQSVYRCSTW
jgi:N-glycosylase/DNA lyase